MSRSHEFRSHGGNDLEFAGQAYLHSDFARIAQARSAAQIETAMPVSYTHLTLPTTERV